jgi:hypothetical protein
MIDAISLSASPSPFDGSNTSGKDLLPVATGAAETASNLSPAAEKLKPADFSAVGRFRTAMGEKPRTGELLARAFAGNGGEPDTVPAPSAAPETATASPATAKPILLDRMRPAPAAIRFAVSSIPATGQPSPAKEIPAAPEPAISAVPAAACAIPAATEKPILLDKTQAAPAEIRVGLPAPVPPSAPALPSQPVPSVPEVSAARPAASPAGTPADRATDFAMAGTGLRPPALPTIERLSGTPRTAPTPSGLRQPGLSRPRTVQPDAVPAQPAAARPKPIAAPAAPAAVAAAPDPVDAMPVAPSSAVSPPASPMPTTEPMTASPDVSAARSPVLSPAEYLAKAAENLAAAQVGLKPLDLSSFGRADAVPGGTATAGDLIKIAFASPREARTEVPGTTRPIATGPAPVPPPVVDDTPEKSSAAPKPEAPVVTVPVADGRPIASEAASVAAPAVPAQAAPVAGKPVSATPLEIPVAVSAAPVAETSPVAIPATPEPVKTPTAIPAATVAAPAEFLAQAAQTLAAAQPGLRPLDVSFLGGIPTAPVPPVVEASPAAIPPAPDTVKTPTAIPAATVAAPAEFLSQAAQTLAAAQPGLRPLDASFLGGIPTAPAPPVAETSPAAIPVAPDTVKTPTAIPAASVGAPAEFLSQAAQTLAAAQPGLRPLNVSFLGDIPTAPVPPVAEASPATIPVAPEPTKTPTAIPAVPVAAPAEFLAQAAQTLAAAQPGLRLLDVSFLGGIPTAPATPVAETSPATIPAAPDTAKTPTAVPAVPIAAPAEFLAQAAETLAAAQPGLRPLVFPSFGQAPAMPERTANANDWIKTAFASPRETRTDVPGTAPTRPVASNPAPVPPPVVDDMPEEPAAAPKPEAPVIIVPVVEGTPVASEAVSVAAPAVPTQAGPVTGNPVPAAPVEIPVAVSATPVVETSPAAIPASPESAKTPTAIPVAAAPVVDGMAVAPQAAPIAAPAGVPASAAANPAPAQPGLPPPAFSFLEQTPTAVPVTPIVEETPAAPVAVPAMPVQPIPLDNTPVTAPTAVSAAPVPASTGIPANLIVETEAVPAVAAVVPAQGVPANGTPVAQDSVPAAPAAPAPSAPAVPDAAPLAAAPAPAAPVAADPVRNAPVVSDERDRAAKIAAQGLPAAPVALPPDMAGIGQTVSPDAVQAADAAAATARTREIAEAVESIVAAMEISPGLAQGKGEIRFFLKPEILDGSEIALAVDGDALAVTVAPATPDVARLVASHAAQFQEQLAAHAPSFRVTVGLSSRRSRDRNA